MKPESKLTDRQELLVAKLYDELLSFRFAKTDSQEGVKSLALNLIFKIDSFINDHIEREK